MWNLLSIVREMYKRNDRNSIPLLEIVTLQCLETAQIMIWWFNTKVLFSGFCALVQDFYELLSQSDELTRGPPE
jgi:hypothetical protein